MIALSRIRRTWDGPIIRAGSLTFTGPGGGAGGASDQKEKSDRRVYEVLYKLDVSRIFPARRCASGYQFRDKVAILIRYEKSDMKIISETLFAHLHAKHSAILFW